MSLETQKLATEKQRRFFSMLCKELGVDDIDSALESFSSLTIAAASAKLDELLAQREAQRAMESGSA